MAWGEQPLLTERFEAVRTFLKQACKHWKQGSSYDGWVAAQLREANRLMPLVVERLRTKMQELQNHQTCGGWNALAVDGSQATCPRTAENQQAMGDLGRPDGMPQMSLTGILHLPTGLPWDFRVGPGTDSERVHLRAMLDDLPDGSLLVADAGFVGYDLCRTLYQNKQHFLLRVGGNLHLINSLGYDFEVDGDNVFLWPAKQQNQNHPPLRLRLIVLHDEPKQPVYLVTSVLDCSKLSDGQADQIYQARWGIEVQFRTIKQTIGHHRMRSRTPDTCYLEMSWAFLGVWALQLMTASKIAAAGGAPDNLSAAQARNTVRRVLRHQPPCPRTRQGLSRVLARCLIDSYVRRGDKASRGYPRKKRQKPPNPPIIKSPTSLQLRKAKQLTPISMQI